MAMRTLSLCFGWTLMPLWAGIAFKWDIYVSPLYKISLVGQHRRVFYIDAPYRLMGAHFTYCKQPQGTCHQTHFLYIQLKEPKMLSSIYTTPSPALLAFSCIHKTFWCTNVTFINSTPGNSIFLLFTPNRVPAGVHTFLRAQNRYSDPEISLHQIVKAWQVGPKWWPQWSPQRLQRLSQQH